MGLSDAEIIRLAAGVGLERLKRINYDLAKAVCDASENKQIFPSTVVLPSPTPDRIRHSQTTRQYQKPAEPCKKWSPKKPRKNERQRANNRHGTRAPYRAAMARVGCC